MAITRDFVAPSSREGGLMDNVFEFPPGGDRTPDIEENLRGPDNRVPFRASPDNFAELVDRLEDLIKSLGIPLFRRGEFIVRAGRVTEKLPDGTSYGSLLSPSVSVESLGEILESRIAAVKVDARSRRNVSSHMPKDVLKTFISKGPFSKIYPLTGLTDIPIVLSSGKLLNEPGYDPDSGIFYAPCGLEFNLKEHPTLEDATVAVETLKKLLDEFAFVSDTDLSVAISRMMSAVNRPSLGPTPLLAITSPTPRTGKGYLSGVISIVATGSLAVSCTQGVDEEELEKRLSSQLLQGRRVISIDNCTWTLRGAAICSYLTERVASIRVLGRSDLPSIVMSSFIMANGNNLALGDDLNPRSVLCQMDAKKENPGSRSFNKSAQELARENRGEYVSACLTIILAYQKARAPNKTTPLAGFETWSRMIRES